MQINLEGLALENREDTISIEIIHQTGNDLRINIIDRDEMMLTRIEVAVENDVVILKTWKPERWEKRSPDHKILFAKNL